MQPHNGHGFSVSSSNAVDFVLVQFWNKGRARNGGLLTEAAFGE